MSERYDDGGGDVGGGGDALAATVGAPSNGGATCSETSAASPAERHVGASSVERPAVRESEVERDDDGTLLRAGEPMSCAPVTQQMDAEPETFAMDALHAFYESEGSAMNWLYNCLFCPVCAYGDVVVAHDIAQRVTGTFDTPAGRSFQRKNDITCLPGCWKPALAMSACTILLWVTETAYPLTATSSIACENFQHVLSTLSTAWIVYFGGSNRRRIMDAYGIREPPCNLGCCKLQPPFNPYCCWFWCMCCASAQEHKIMLRVLRSRARDAAYEQL